MMNYIVVLDGNDGSVYDFTGWYLVSISWNCLVLGGTGSAKGLYVKYKNKKIQKYKNANMQKCKNAKMQKCKNAIMQ